MPNKFVSLLPTLPQAQAYGRNVPKPKVFAGSLHSRPGESPRGSESSPSVAAAGSGPVAGNGGRGRPEADSALEMEELQRGVCFRPPAAAIPRHRAASRRSNAG